MFSGNASGNEAAQGLFKITMRGSDLLASGSVGLEVSVVAFVLCPTTGFILLVSPGRHGRLVRPS